MLCTHCQTPNPDGAPTCLQCHESLDESGATLAPPSAGVTSTPTIAPAHVPSSQASSRRSPSGSLASFSGPSTLPEGFDIGHRYRVVKLLGRGGMGAVYKVRDLELDRDVALKLIRPEIAEDQATLDRFKREIQLSSRITHKNVLRVYDLGEVEGIKFLTMQFVDGDDLASLIKREGHLPLPRVLAIFGEICRGLAAAHEQGVIHRDLKPQNIMLDAAGTAYVTDFGLAKSLAGTGMTEMGAILGTPFYMSPEQVKGEKAGPASDIYSLGVILYEMLTGVVPFTGDSAYQVMVRRLTQKPKAAAELNPDIPAFLQKIMERCMATDPAARYPNAEAVLADLAAGTFSTNVRFELLRRRWVLMVGAAAVLAALAVGGVVWLSRRRPAPKTVEAARPVLVADFTNKTGDPVFDGTLETAFGIALEDAAFITSYRRDAARKVAAQLQPGTTGLPEPVARLVAAREGVGVVTAGSVAAEGSGYKIAVRAVDATTGKVLVSAEASASDKNAVLGAVAKLASKVRGALGDTTPESARIAAAETFTAGSFEAAHEYAVAQDAQFAGKWDEAARDYRRAAELDPNMGRAYAGLAAVYQNQGKHEEAKKTFEDALARLERMSDREKFRTRGLYYVTVRKPDRAVEELKNLVAQYPSDTNGIANLALAYFYKRDMAQAVAVGKRFTEIYPRAVPQRNNVGLFAMYGGDFETAVKEQRAVLDLNPKFHLAFVGLALSQLAEGKPDEARETWKGLAAVDAHGASLAAMGLADMALAEGKPAEAVPLLEKGAADDLASKDTDAAAGKLVSLAEAQLALGKEKAALASAEKAVSLARGENILFPAAQVLVAAGKTPRALELAADLGKRLEDDPRAYGKLIEAEAQLKAGKAGEAVRTIESARAISDTWLGRFLSGRAYVEAGAFTEADGELERCAKRRGEATAAFLDEVPSWRLYGPVLYWRGRAQEGLKSPAAADSFKAFLAIRGNAGGDPLVADARRRLGESK
jgi:tetratricopeptide (TPR) repeat protein